MGAKRKLIKNNIIATMGLSLEDDSVLDKLVDEIIKYNKTAHVHTADLIYDLTGNGTPCMDGMGY